MALNQKKILAHCMLSRELTAEGAVLLENHGVLPIGKTGTVALFGSGAFQTRTSAGGMMGPGPGGPPPGEAGAAPGGPAAPEGPPPGMPMGGAVKRPGFHQNLSDALAAAGYTLVNDETGAMPETDPGYVIYVLRRDSAEGSDRKPEPGDYYLTEKEQTELCALARRYGNVILLLNCCSVTDFYNTYAEINEAVPYGIGAVLLLGLGGEGAGDAAVQLLNGTVTPSGKLADTWALDYEDYPSAPTFGERGHTNFESFGDNEYYFEDIYTGYRYFDTFHVPVAYPFGFGRSYTSFAVETRSVALSEDGRAVELSVRVKNTGACAGKEVVQVYGSYCFRPGVSKLETPYQVLVAAQKTELLAPGDLATVELTVPFRQMASYDEETDSFLLQRGEYLLRVGNSSRNTAIAAKLTLDQDVVTEQCTPGLFAIKNDTRTPGDDREILEQGRLCYRKITRTPLPFENWDGSQVPKIALSADALAANKRTSISPYDPNTVTTLVSDDPANDSAAWKDRTTPNRSGRKEVYRAVQTRPGATLLDVDEGNVTMEQFVAGLSNVELADLVTGLSSEQTEHLLDQTSPLLHACPDQVSGYQSTKNLITARLIPQVFQADGPESPGITLGFDDIWAGATDNSGTSEQYAAVILPAETVMAQSWNPALVREMGRAVGEEMLEAGLSIWLAPGANIHRNPLCGRNYQYYSEDPYLTGLMLTAEVSGVQSHPGVFCCAKHFAANNMETNRGEINEVISVRALREIYLPGWRMCAESESPNGAYMSAYNQINGTYCGENYDLLMHLIRGEWGWQGLVMDDYTPWFFLCWRDLTVCPQMGNDLVMPGNTANNVSPVPFIPLENPVADMVYDGVRAPFQSDTYLMLSALKNGTLLLGDLQRSAINILELYRRMDVFFRLKQAAKMQARFNQT